MPITLDELTVADEPRAWEALGFEVDGDLCVLGEVRIRLTGSDQGSKGLAGWSLRGAESTELDGLPTTSSKRDPASASPAHSNGITGVDHVVAITPSLERTIAVLEAAGFDLRRIREEPTPAGAPRQAFFRIGAPLLEVVQEPDHVVAKKGGDRPAFFWGVALTAPDLDVTASQLGERIGEIRPAVQSGRRIATLRRSAGLSVPVAVMTPPAGS